jgi:hypothetical protein
LDWRAWSAFYHFVDIKGMMGQRQTKGGFMLWDKGNGQRMEAQDNEETNKYLTSLGFKKVGIEIGEPAEQIDPAEDTHEISMDEMPSQGEPQEPEKEEQSIAPEDVGEMPKDILGG